jgi:hypothetical protein
MAEHSGSEFALVLIEQETDLFTKEVAPAGIRLPFDSWDGNPGMSSEEHVQITGTQIPAGPLDGFFDPSAKVTAAANLDSFGWWLRHAVAIPTTAGAVDPYNHTFGLGNANGMPIAAEIALQSNETGPTNISRLWWGGRVASFGGSLEAKGAIMLDIGWEFYRLDGWAAAHAVAAPTEYDSEVLVDCGIGVWNLTGSPVSYLTSFKWNIDRRVTARHPAGVGGLRSTVNRGVPSCSGSLAGFANDDAIDDMIDAAEAKTPVTMSWVYTISAGPPLRRLTVTLTDARLYLTSEKIAMEGVDFSFDWKAAGAADCITFRLDNSVVAYAP